MNSDATPGWDKFNKLRAYIPESQLLEAIIQWLNDDQKSELADDLSKAFDLRYVIDDDD